MKVFVTDANLIITLTGWEKLFSLHGDFHIPLSNITSVVAAPIPWTIWELRLPGTFFPGIIKSGTYYTKRGKEYWYVTYDRIHTYTIELHNSSYKRLKIGFKHKQISLEKLITK